MPIVEAMTGPVRGLLAIPAFLAYGFVALTVGGTGGLSGVALLGLGAVAAGYLVDSPWALSIAAPFVVYGVVNIDDPGPLENTDVGWGLLILIALALPVAAGTGIGLALKAVSRRSSGNRS
jgi:hypothetical protein